MQSFSESQRRYFERSDPRRFFWQTAHRYVAPLERQLLEPLVEWSSTARRLLEIGCGEGANLVLSKVASQTRCWVMDRSWDRVRFATRQTNGFGICGDGTALPFREASFDLVLIRDVLHHVEDPLSVVQETARVMLGGGRLVSIEPNGRNPVIRALAIAQAEERGVRRFSPLTVARWLEQCGFQDIHVQMKHPLPLWRIALHYKYGLPGLAQFNMMRRVFDLLDRWSQRRFHSDDWAYAVVCASSKRCAAIS